MINNNYNEFAEQFKKPDGSINWGRAATEWMEKESVINNNLSLKKKLKTVEELSVFKLANELSEMVWNIVFKWDMFAKKTVGDQWVRATDSIAANIVEGYGRYFFGENIIFLYYSRGSAYEAKFWCDKAHERQLLVINNQLLNDKLYNELKLKFEKLPIEINKVVKIIKTQKQQWKGKPKW